MFVKASNSRRNTCFIYFSSCVIYKITNIKALVNGFLIFPSHIFIILYLFINILYFNLIFIEFMGIFLYIIIFYSYRIRFTTTFIDFCISFTYKLSSYRFNNFHIHRYNINLHKIRISIFQSSFDWQQKFTILNNIKRKNRPIQDDF